MSFLLLSQEMPVSCGAAGNENCLLCAGPRARRGPVASSCCSCQGPSPDTRGNTKFFLPPNLQWSPVLCLIALQETRRPRTQDKLFEVKALKIRWLQRRRQPDQQTPRPSQDLHVRGNDQHCSRTYMGTKFRRI